MKKKVNGHAHTPEHIRKFLKGDLTPRETHIAAMNKRCEQCGAPASVRLRTLVLLDELVQRSPELVAQIMVTIRYLQILLSLFIHIPVRQQIILNLANFLTTKLTLS